jgi:glycine/D-amino acid oxidase-like deaminating enzyme
MGPAVDPVASDETLPARASVAIIGGGIIGASTALELADRGVDVALFEKGHIAGEQSSRNWGWCRQMGRDPREIPLILESLKIWHGLDARIEGETGFTQCGIMYLSDTAEKLAADEKWYEDNARPYQLQSRMVTSDEVAKLQPQSSKRWVGGLYTPNDCRAEPQKAAPAIAKAVRARGGRIFQSCAVRGIETAAGRVSGIVTEKGAMACDTVVLAGGAWSRRFLGNLDIPFPQLTVINSVMRTEPLDGPAITAAGENFAFRKRRDGGYTIAHHHAEVADITPDSFRLFFDFLPALKAEWKAINLRFGKRFFSELKLKRRWRLDERSPFEEMRVIDPEPVDWVLAEAEASLKTCFPVFEAMKIAQRWAGCIDVTPDAVPVISPIAKLPGLFLASGFSGHGFGLGPGAGRLMADLVTGKTPVVDPAPFRYTRYYDGSNPRITTGV